MKRPLVVLGTLLLLFGSLSCRADQFAFEVQSPKFRISLPGMPQMKMDVHPMNASRPHMRFLGSNGPHTISIITPTAAKGMTPLECAGATVRTMGNRSGVPQASQIYKARIDDNTYVAIYASPLDGIVRLNAHIMSAVGGTHCIEVHASKMTETDDELIPWVDSFSKASIQPD